MSPSCLANQLALANNRAILATFFAECPVYCREGKSSTKAVSSFGFVSAGLTVRLRPSKDVTVAVVVFGGLALIGMLYTKLACVAWPR